MASTNSHRPIRHGPYPELTWPAVLVGWLLGCLIAVSIGYAALILGFSIEGSELAAILGWGILRGILGRSSIIENNINQTIASAVNGASAGMMFSIPALFILATKDPEGKFAALTQFNVGLMVLACITGGILGLSFIIPLRKQMIDFDRLAYPGGIAVAAILKSPGAGMKKAVLLLAGGAISGTFYILVMMLSGTDHPDWSLGSQLQLPAYLNITLFLSLMTVGVGFLSGKGGFWFGAGGFLCYWVLAPLLSQFGAGTEKLMADPDALRATLFRPTGIGMLIGAAIGGIVAAFPLIRSAMKSMHEARHDSDGHDARPASDEMPIWLLYVGVGAGLIALIVICHNSVSDPQMTWWRAATMAVLGTVWVWVAGVIVSECLGRTNWSPLSGMTLIAVTILLVIAQSGMAAPSAVLSSVIIGAAICVAIAQAGDMMLDLKSGYLVGAMPRRQQVAQFIGSWLGPLVVIGLIIVLHEQYTLGSESLPAPQGTALASMVEGIVERDVPAYRYVAGGGLGAVLSFSGLGGIGVLIGLGFYMPFDIVLTYTIGNLLRILSDRFAGKRFSEQVGVPIAAGLIVGEALVGVGYAFYQILLG